MRHTLTRTDALDGLRGLPDASVRGVVTSPPYNLGEGVGNFPEKGHWPAAARGIGKGYDQHRDDMPYEDYVAWQRDVLTECMRVCRPDGAIFYNHKWRVQKGRLRNHAGITDGLPWPVRQVVIWRRPGGVNWSLSFFVPTFEVVYLFAPPAFRLPKRCVQWGDVWDIPPELGTEHPAPFPVRLAARCVTALGSGPVLDPFAGSGTVAVAAERLDADSIGFDLSEEYLSIARRRLKKEEASPRLPFGEVA